MKRGNLRIRLSFLPPTLTRQCFEDIRDSDDDDEGYVDISCKREDEEIERKMKIEMEREFQRTEGRTVSEREGKRVRDRERKTETEMEMEMGMEKELESEGAKERNAETAQEHGIVKQEDDDDLFKDLLQRNRERAPQRRMCARAGGREREKERAPIYSAPLAFVVTSLCHIWPISIPLREYTHTRCTRIRTPVQNCSLGRCEPMSYGGCVCGTHIP